MSNNLSTVASFGRMAMNPTPFGAAGLGLGIAKSMFGGKGGEQNPGPAKIGGSNGNYAYSNRFVSDVPINTSKFNIQGDNGNYNVLPLLQTPKVGEVVNGVQIGGGRQYKKSAERANSAMYDSIMQQMSGDQLAIDNFNNSFGAASTRNVRPMGVGPIDQQQFWNNPIAPMNNGYGMFQKQSSDSNMTPLYNKTAAYARAIKDPILRPNKPTAAANQSAPYVPAYMTPQAAMAARA